MRASPCRAWPLRPLNDGTVPPGDAAVLPPRGRAARARLRGRPRHEHGGRAPGDPAGPCHRPRAGLRSRAGRGRGCRLGGARVPGRGAPHRGAADGQAVVAHDRERPHPGQRAGRRLPGGARLAHGRPRAHAARGPDGTHRGRCRGAGRRRARVHDRDVGHAPVFPVVHRGDAGDRCPADRAGAGPGAAGDAPGARHRDAGWRSAPPGRARRAPI